MANDAKLERYKQRDKTNKPIKNKNKMKNQRTYKLRKNFWQVLQQFSTSKNQCKVSLLQYKGIDIYEHLIIPYFWGKDIILEYVVPIILPLDTVIKNGVVKNYYENEGFGSCYFNDIADAKNFIDNFKNQN